MSDKNLQPSQQHVKAQSLIWHDYTSNKHYFIDQAKGTQDRSDPHGNVVRAFDPNLTGKYDYDARKKLQEGLPVNFGGVELPKSLGPSLNRIYSPENIRFEGCSQFPMPLSMPYQNEKLALSKDFVQKKRSRESMHQIKTMRESFMSKWNKKLITNVTENENFKANNVGASFLTSPISYTQQPEIKTLITSNREKINRELQGYSSKLEKKSLFASISPQKGGEQLSGSAEVNKSKPNTIKSPEEQRIERLAKTFAENLPGQLKHGRRMIDTQYNRLSITQVTSPVSRTNGKDDFSPAKTQNFMKTKPELNSTKKPSHTQSVNAWQSTMSPQEILTMRNLFQDFKERSRSGSRTSDKGGPHGNTQYGKFKNARISEMTKRAEQDPRVTQYPDMQTGIFGHVPRYDTLKSTHRQKIRPFFGTKTHAVTSPSSRPLSPDMTGVNWSKVTDSKQSIKILESLDSKGAFDEDFSELEILGGSTKTAGSMTFKLRTEQAIQDQIKFKKSVLDRLKTKGRFAGPIETSAGHYIIHKSKFCVKCLYEWIIDKEWQLKANPEFREAEKKRELLDKKLLEKRRNGRILKNMALEAQFKIQVKMPAKI